MTDAELLPADDSEFYDCSRTELRDQARYIKSIDPAKKQRFVDYVFAVANGELAPKYQSSVRTCENIAAQLIKHEDKMALEHLRAATSGPEQHLHLHGDAGSGPSAQDIGKAALQEPGYLDYLRGE